MKTEALKELKAAYDHLKFERDVDAALASIKRVLCLEQPSSTGKFNIYDYVAKDKDRPVMTGVYHKQGMQVASDGYMLVCLCGVPYESEYEGKIRLRNGDLLGEGYRYPNYNAVYPKSSTTPVQIDKDKVRQAFKELKAARKLIGDKELRHFVQVRNTYFELDKFIDLVKFMDYIGTDTLYIDSDDSNRAGLVKAENGSWGVLMPYYVKDAYGLIITDIEKK